MNQLCSDGVTREANPKSRNYSAPNIDGERFAVVQVGTFWTVRRRTFAKGVKTSDGLWDTYLTEKDADTACRLLATPRIEVEVGDGE